MRGGHAFRAFDLSERLGRHADWIAFARVRTAVAILAVRSSIDKTLKTFANRIASASLLGRRRFGMAHAFKKA